MLPSNAMIIFKTGWRSTKCVWRGHHGRWVSFANQNTSLQICCLCLTPTKIKNNSVLSPGQWTWVILMRSQRESLLREASPNCPENITPEQLSEKEMSRCLGHTHCPIPTRSHTCYSVARSHGKEKCSSAQLEHRRFKGVVTDSEVYLRGNYG